VNRNHQSARSALLAAIGVVAYTMAASAAFGQPPVAEPSRQRTANLTLAGLDLSQAADAEIARDRIRHLAQKFCDRMWDPLSLSQHATFLDCVDRATAGAELKLQRLASAKTRAVKLAAVQR
jgi:UrcA family protein